MTTKSKQANPTQDSDEQLRQILTDLYYAQSRLTGTSTDPGTSRGAQLRKAKAALLAWRDQEVVKELKNLRDSEIANVSIRSLQVRINGRIKILTKNGGTDQ